MRPLAFDIAETKDVETDFLEERSLGASAGRSVFERNLNKLKAIHHSQCLFNRKPLLVPEIQLFFDSTGILYGEFTCGELHQGYNKMAHGGIVASIVDASMAQCLMGHSVVGYTVDLSVKYRKPVRIGKKSTLETSITAVHCGCLYSMKCEIIQNHNRVVQADGKFYKVN